VASRGKTTQLDHMYVADFETGDSVPNGDENTPQRVWLAGYKNLETMESTYFHTLDDFMENILSRGDNMNTEYAFHNIKFDGSYIVPYLLTHGYEYTERKPEPKQFSVLVDERNAWYSLTIQVTKRRRVLLWDSLKLFPCALEYLPDIYTTPTKKVREDKSFYEVFRPEGYIPDKRDMEYFENDLQVPAETLRKHIELYGLRFKKTQASQAFYNFEQSFKGWKLRFPPLSNVQDESIRQSYWGGIAYVPTKVRGRDYYNIGVYDINSSYPHKLAELKMPYGPCIAEYGEGKHPDMSKFWVAQALVEFTLKPNHLPSIPMRSIEEGRPVPDEDDEEEVIDKWITESKGIVRMTFCNIDYQTMCESYNIKIWRWCWSMHWAWKVQREVAKFVHKNNDIKVKSSKLAKKETDPQKKAEYNTMRNRAKTDNNAFYGKFGEDIIKKGKSPYWEEKDGVEQVVWRLDREEELSEGKRKFLPVAIAITAWGRQQLVGMANVLGEHFLYCDTDSIHYLMEGQYKIDKAIKDGIFEVDNEKLGAWKLEGQAERGRYLRAKCYMELMIDDKTDEKHLEATVAGLPADKHTGQFSKKRSCLNWDNFHIGHIVPPDKSNKLRTVRTPTGNKLVPTGFQIKEKDTLYA
jgi:hypothetical protein